MSVSFVNHGAGSDTICSSFPPKVTFSSLAFGGQSPCRVFEFDVCPENIYFHRTRVVWVQRILEDQSVEFPHHEQGLLSLGQVTPSPV